MHKLTSPEINTYAEGITTPESPLLAHLNRETNMKVEMPVMLSGHLQGAVLRMLSLMLRPQAILEIGTYTGYSAICLAAGLQQGGRLHTIDINEELADMCRYYWTEAGLSETVVPHIGQAADILPKLEGPFDLVFIDADKVGYASYYDLVWDKVPVGGWIIADNVLYDAEVILPEAEQSKNAKAMHAYNRKIAGDDRVEQVLLPIRDGLLAARKLRE